MTPHRAPRDSLAESPYTPAHPAMSPASPAGAPRWYAFARTARVRLRAPPARAYDVLTDPANVPRYERNITSLVPLDPPGPRRRMRSAWRVLFGWTLHATYTVDYRPGRAWVGREDAGARLVRGLYVVALRETADGGTEVTHTEAIEARWRWLAVAAGVTWFAILWLTRSSLPRQCERMRALVDGDDAPATAPVPASASTPAGA